MRKRSVPVLIVVITVSLMTSSTKGRELRTPAWEFTSRSCIPYGETCYPWLSYRSLGNNIRENGALIAITADRDSGPTYELSQGLQGSVVLLDAKTRLEIASYYDPTPAHNEYFARAIDLDAQHLAVTTLWDNEAGENAGALSIYGLQGGEPVRRWLNPDSARIKTIGLSVALVGDHVFVHSYTDPALGNQAHAVEQFSLSTGLHRGTLVDPTTPNHADLGRVGFGRYLSRAGESLLVSDVSGAHLYRPSDGQLLRTFSLPPSAGYVYSVTASDSYVVLGALGEVASAHVYDTASGELVQSFLGRNPNGWESLYAKLVNVATRGDYVLLGENFDRYWPGQDIGQVSLFHIPSGSCVTTFADPSPDYYNGHFASAVAFSGSQALVGAEWKNSVATDAGVVYGYELPEWQASSTGPDIDGNGRVDLADAAVIAQHLGDKCASLADGDLTGDQRVNLEDLLMLRDHLGTIVNPNAQMQVPEPSTTMLILTSSVLWIVRRRLIQRNG